MADMDKVIKGLEQFKADLKPFCGNHADWERFDAGLSMLKEHKEHEELLTILGYHWTGSGETLALCKRKDGEQE